MTNEIQRSLGRIEGKLEAIGKKLELQDDDLKKVGERVGKLEVKSATHGAIAGGIAGVGISLLIAKIKSHLGI